MLFVPYNPPKITKEQLETAKVLRSQQFTWKKIAEQLGVTEGSIRTAASRNGWAKHVTTVTQATAKLVMDRIDDEIAICVSGAIELAKEGLNGLRNNKTRTMKPKDLREYAGALRELVQVQRQALGMSEKASTQVNIGIVDYGSVSQGGQTSSPEPADQTIDIE